MFDKVRSEEINAVVLPVLSIERWTSPIPLSEHHRDAIRPYFVKGILRIFDNVDLIVPKPPLESSADGSQFGEKSALDDAKW